MNSTFLTQLAAAAVAAGAIAPATVLTADAQQIDATWNCQDVGNSSMEPLQASAGPAMGVLDYVCVATSGPLSGGVDTGRVVSVFDKSGGALVTGTGVIRRPDATAVYLTTDQKLEYMMSDGKVVGVTGTGHGHYVLTAGAAAPLAGKSFTMTSKTTGPHQFIVEETYQ